MQQVSQRLSLEEGLRRHPNVVCGRPILAPLIPPSEYRVISAKKVHRYIDELAKNENILGKYLPNLLAIDNNIVNGSMQRERFDYRLGKLKRDQPDKYNAHIVRIVDKLHKYSSQKQLLVTLEREVAEELANLKVVASELTIGGN